MPPFNSPAPLFSYYPKQVPFPLPLFFSSRALPWRSEVFGKPRDVQRTGNDLFLATATSFHTGNSTLYISDEFSRSSGSSVLFS